MQGLLGNSMDDPRAMAVLQGVMGLLGARGNVQGVAQGLLGYQGAMQQAKQQAAQEDERATRRQMAEMQLRQAQQQAAKAKAIEAAYRGAIRTPDQMAMAAHGGPTNAAAQAAPGMAPGVDQNALLRGLMQADPQAAFQMLQPKPADYKVVGDALLQVGPSGVKEAYRAPAKPEAMPSAVREYEYARQQGYQGTFQQFKAEMARAGASSTSVSYGAPMAGVDAQGRPVFFQPSKDGGKPAIIPGVAPPKTRLGEKQTNQNAGIDALSQAIGEYVNQLGTWSKLDVLSPDKRAEMGTYYKNLMLQAKEAYNLGVLNGPDLGILMDVVQDPVSIMGTLTSNQALAKQATNLNRFMNKVKSNNLGQSPGQPSNVDDLLQKYGGN
jgi:hypothetical protein